MNRRTLLTAAPAAMLTAITPRPATARPPQAAPASQGRNLSVHPLGPAFGDWQGTIRETVYPPGASAAAHQHPGPTFGYVVSGRIKWAINGEAPRVLEAGMSFYEPMGSVHSTAANASDTEPAKLAIVILGKPGDEISRPVGKPDR